MQFIVNMSVGRRYKKKYYLMIDRLQLLAVPLFIVHAQTLVTISFP